MMEVTYSRVVDLAGTAFAIQPIVFTWANILLSRGGDEVARSITLYSMNGSSSVFFTFWGILLYPATDAKTVRSVAPS